MGNQLSSVVPSLGLVLPVERYFQGLPEYQFISNLGSTRFMKAAFVHHAEGLCVIKVFVLHDPTLSLEPHRLQIVLLSSALKAEAAVHCVPFERVIITDKAALLIRPFSRDTLYDRLSTRPFLTRIEQRWIAFQLLKALAECERAGVCHGDLKCENVFVSSWNWVQIADFASFKPVYLPNDNPSDFSYFFDSSRRRICYIAPERFKADSSANAQQFSMLLSTDVGEHAASPLTHAMDIFSMGCIFMELLTEGSCIPFDFAQMLAFSRGHDGCSPHGLIDEKIDCPHFRELLHHMLQRDPDKRFSASKYLELQRNRAFPAEFYDVLWHYMHQFAEIPLQSYDTRMMHIHSSFSTLQKQLNLATNKDFALILLSLVNSLMRSLKLCSRKLQALELLEKLAPYFSSDVVLNRVLPYVLDYACDPFARIRAEAVKTLTVILNCITELPQTDFRVFTSFILPKTAPLAADRSCLVRIRFSEHLSMIAEHGCRFLRYASEHAHIDPEILPDSMVNESINLEHRIEMKSFQDALQEMVVQLLSDHESEVRIALVSNGVAKLCTAFGRQKTADVLLSHLITFLNDKNDWRLRATFFNAIPAVVAYVGWQSILIVKPLLQQGFRDFEESVVLAAFCSLAELSRLGALQKPHSYELLADSVCFLCHPNHSIRIAVAEFIACLANQLNIADVHCKILPMLNPYLKHSLIKVEKPSAILQTVTDPITRQVFDLVSRSNLIQPLFEFLREKHMVRQMNRSNEPTGSYMPEDPQLVQFYEKLLNRGLSTQMEIKLLGFREVLVKQHKLRVSLSDEYSPLNPSRPGQVDLSVHSINRRAADLVDTFQPIAVITDSKIPELNRYDAHLQGSTSAERGIGNTIPNDEWQQMFSATVVAVEEASEAAPISESRASTVKLSSSEMCSTLTGHGNDFDITSANGLYHSATCYRDLHTLVKCKQEEYLESTRIGLGKWNAHGAGCLLDLGDWKPSGRLIAHLHEHRAAVNRLSLHPNGYVFASCCNDGTVKLWDCQRMESKSMVNRSRVTFTNSTGRKIKTLTFCKNGEWLAIANDQCQLQILQVESNSKILPMVSLATDPHDEGGFIELTSVDGHPSLLMGVTHHGRIKAWDLRLPMNDHTSAIWELTNSTQHGLVTGFCAGPHWVCVGTDTGHLVTWDLRFQLSINRCHHPSYKRIARLWMDPLHSNGVIASIAGNSEVTLWDLETSARRLSLWSVEQPLMSYQEMSDVTTTAVWWSPDVRKQLVITGDSRACIRCWNVKDVKQSFRISTPGSDCKSMQYLYKSQVVDGIMVNFETEMRSQIRRPGESDGPKGPLDVGSSESHHDTISDLLVCRTGQWVLVSASRDGVIKLWK